MAGRRGMVLVLMSGVLVLLAGLVAAFVLQSRAGRAAERAAVDGARAGLLARSGVERALADIVRGGEPSYGGEDYDGDGAWAAAGVERDAQGFDPARLDIEGCPAAFALRPSYFSARQGRRAGGEPAPDLLRDEGRLSGTSGRLRGSHVADGDPYVLRVVREAGVHLNDGPRTAPDPDLPAHAMLRRVLGTLAEALDREDGADDGAPVDGSDGERLLDLRPVGGWLDFEQVRAIALGGDAGRLRALRPYLSLDAWVFPGAVWPTATAAMEGTECTGWGDLRRMRDPPSPRGDVGGAAPGRAPVSLAWARTRPALLLALLSGLEGLFLDEATASPWFDGDRIGTLRRVRIANDWQAGDDAHVAAQAILASAAPLATWDEWNRFCDGIPFSGGTPAEARAKRDLLKANFNPNAALNKFGPNRSLWKSLDKSDLLALSPEFSLAPISGWEIEAVGRVVDPAGRGIAAARASARTARPRAVHWTTQREFVCEDLGDPEVPGDETGVRYPGEDRFISLNAGAGGTWGHRISMGAMGNRVVPPPGPLWGRGIALQTYPQPYVGAGQGTPGLLLREPAGYDGNLQLATVETGTDETYGITAAPANMKMLGRFDDGFHLDISDAAAASGDPTWGEIVPDTRIVAEGEWTRGVWDRAKPNTLYPDGAYAESGRAPAYYDCGNADGYHGLIAFWVKPNYDPTVASRSRAYVMRANDNGGGDGGSDPPGVSSTNQFWFLGDVAAAKCGTTYWGLTLMFEVGHNADDVLSSKYMEHVFHSYRPVPESPPSAHAWTHISVSWDALGYQYTGTFGNDWGKVGLNDWRIGSRNVYSYDFNNYNGNATDLTADDIHGRHVLCLGPWAPRDYYFDPPTPGGYAGRLRTVFPMIRGMGRGADATFDEVAIWDFGGATAATNYTVPAACKTATQALGTARYRDGRYYKGAEYAPAWGPSVPDEAGSWTTSPVRLPPGAAVRDVLWTCYRPDALPDDYVEIEIVREDADAHLWDEASSRSSLSSRWTSSGQAWRVGRVAPGPFRVRTVFRRATPLGGAGPGDFSQVPNTPVLDSPVLDDLTVLFDPGGGIRLDTWEGD